MFEGDHVAAQRRGGDGSGGSCLEALDAGDLAGYDEAMSPTAALSRVIFEAPTYDYKVGLAFVAGMREYLRASA